MTLKLRVPFGLLNGQLVEAGAVPNGKACDCACPGCGRPLIAYNQGKVRTTTYFGHLPGEDCGKGLESALHLAGKAALIEARKMRLPALEVTMDGIAPKEHPPLHRKTAEAESFTLYVEVEAEVTVDVEVISAPVRALAQADLFDQAPLTQPAYSTTLRPDVRASNRTHTDWVEIRVTHAVGVLKQQLLQQAGMRCIEVDLTQYLKKTPTLEDIRRTVIEDIDCKRWISHPGVPHAQQELTAQWERDAAWNALSVSSSETTVDLSSSPDGPSNSGATPLSWGSTSRDSRRNVDVRALATQQREQLQLGPNEPWPRHLNLDLRNNGGCLSPTRVWLTQVFLQWVHERQGSRYFVSDLVRFVAGRFGVASGWGSRDLNTAIERRVLPYWVACGFVELGEGGLVLVKCGELHPPARHN